MTLKKILLNLAIALSALFFGLLWVGVYQFFVGKTLGDEMRPRIIQHLKEPKFDINDPDSVLPIDFEEDKLSDPKEDEDNPKYFDPEGTYEVKNELAPKFNKFKGFKIINKNFEVDCDNPKFGEEIEPFGYVIQRMSANQVYSTLKLLRKREQENKDSGNLKELYHTWANQRILIDDPNYFVDTENLQINDGNISFKTQKDDEGTSFEFHGSFIIKGNFYALNEDTAVVEGMLIKKENGKYDGNTDTATVQFSWELEVDCIC